MSGELHNYLQKRAGFITPSMTSSGGPGTSYFNEGGKLSQIRHLDAYYDKVAGATLTALSTYIPVYGNFKLLAPIKPFTKLVPPKFVSKLGGFANKAINKGYDVVNEYRRAVDKYEKLGLNAGFSELTFPMYRLYHDSTNKTPWNIKAGRLGKSIKNASPQFGNMLSGAGDTAYNAGKTLGQSAYSAASQGLKSFYKNMTSPDQDNQPFPTHQAGTFHGTLASSLMNATNNVSNSLRKSIQDGIDAWQATWDANKDSMSPGMKELEDNYNSKNVQDVLSKAKDLTPFGDWKEKFENSVVGRLFW